MPTLAQDPTQAEIQHNISHVQRGHFAPSKPPERHEGEHRPLPERAAVQERPDRRPSRHSRHPSLTAWTREPLHRIAHELVTARSEEHTSELQSLRHLVCRLLLEKK